MSLKSRSKPKKGSVRESVRKAVKKMVEKVSKKEPAKAAKAAKDAPVVKSDPEKVDPCFQWAYRVVHSLDTAGKNPVLVHGVVSDTNLESGKQESRKQAWVEAGNLAYDWFTIALQQSHPMTIEAFHATRNPKNMTRYTAEEAAAKFKSKNSYGPWK